MTAHAPVSGTFPHYAARWVDPALGFAIGWNYFYVRIRFSGLLRPLLTLLQVECHHHPERNHRRPDCPYLLGRQHKAHFDLLGTHLLMCHFDQRLWCSVVR